MTTKLINKLCVIGVGLIGGSLARALRKSGAVNQIVGCGRNKDHLEIAKKLGVIDSFSTDLAEAVSNADMIVLAVPLGAMRTVMKQIKGHITYKSVITDVGSAKDSVLKDAHKVFGTVPVNFVPGHPIAGTEQNGVEASFAELFENRRVIVTPHEENDDDAVKKVKAMWDACGANVVEMHPQHHDQILAATSHLPHMLAYGLVDTLARMDSSQEIFDFAAGGFEDFTRIASSDPNMWHDICLANHEALVPVLEKFSDELRQLADAVRNSDSDFIKETFTRAKQARDKFCKDKS